VYNNLPYAVDDPKTFFNMYRESDPDTQAQLSEFYIHNFFVPSNVKWNPNMYLGDILLDAFTSYLKNEKRRKEEADEYLEMEKQSTLMIRGESGYPEDIVEEWVEFVSEDRLATWVRQRWIAVQNRYLIFLDKE
ncbi:hypothetical protein KI387_042454, partial [Taxus chinensis]